MMATSEEIDVEMMRLGVPNDNVEIAAAYERQARRVSMRASAAAWMNSHPAEAKDVWREAGKHGFEGAGDVSPEGLRLASLDAEANIPRRPLWYIRALRDAVRYLPA